MSTLDGRCVVVMGAGSLGEGWGNGKACAVSYARAGASVVCVDFVQARADETVALIEREGGTAVAMSADATDEAAVQAVIDGALAAYGRLDVVHNNVGVGGTTGTPDQITLEQWNREVDQNLTTAFLGIRCAVPVMRERGGGVITNTSSLLAVRFLRRPNVAYTASKAAVEALTRACAVAYGRDNIRVNCLRIGFSETPLVESGLMGMTDEAKEAAMARSRAKVPLRGEHTDPFDVAAAAVFLASDDARNLTGVILNVDGGLECAPL